MKSKPCNHIITFAVLSILILGCKKSDDGNQDNGEEEITFTEIVDDNVENADVNAADYWDNIELVWSDEFEDNSNFDKNWRPEVYSEGQSNSELQAYTAKDNVEINNGKLKIIAKKIGDRQEVGDYTSARLNSKYAFKYGRLEIRAKLPKDSGNGLWVKLWMLGSNVKTIGYPACGEILIMKYVSHLPNEIYSTVQNAENFYGKGQNGNFGPINVETAEEEFHNYGILWTDEYLKFYVDDIDNITFTFKRPEAPTTSNWPFSSSFYFGFDISVGGLYGGVEGVDDSIFPSVMEIDYVRVYHAK